MRSAYPNAPDPWIDLSTGINPWPYPDQAISEAALAHLPTRSAYEGCRQAMATSIGAPPDSLLPAPGSELLIRLLPDVIRPSRVAILSLTYGDHAIAWARAGSDIIHSDDPLSLAEDVDAIVLTHPNNPDGRLFDLQALEEARLTLAAKGGWLILDEAYADLTPDCSFASKGGEAGLIVLRSFGKFFGLAGLRLGAVLAPERVRQPLSERLGVWPISGSALEIGARAYADHDWQIQTRQALSHAADRLDTILKEGGLTVVGGTSLFRFVDVDKAHDAFEHLAQSGIYVRRFEGSDRHLRIGLPATPEAEARLKAALRLLG